MGKLSFKAIVADVWERPTSTQLQAAKLAGEDASHDSPRFGVRLLLARLNVANGNGHKLSLEETKKALAKLGDRQFIPGGYNHNTPAMGTSTMTSNTMIKNKRFISFSSLV